MSRAEVTQVAPTKPLPEMRCPYCFRLLFVGHLNGEIKCKCGKVVSFGVAAR